MDFQPLRGTTMIPMELADLVATMPFAVAVGVLDRRRIAVLNP